MAPRRLAPSSGDPGRPQPHECTLCGCLPSYNQYTFVHSVRVSEVARSCQHEFGVVKGMLHSVRALEIAARSRLGRVDALLVFGEKVAMVAVIVMVVLVRAMVMFA